MTTLKKFGVHKLWFCYNDQWFATRNELATCLGSYDTLAQAEEVKKQHDIAALRGMKSYDCVQDLMGFIEERERVLKKSPKGSADNEEISLVDQLVAYADLVGWSVRGDEDSYYEIPLPDNATNEQLWQVIQITGAYFHRIVEYKQVEKCATFKFYLEFWGQEAFSEIEKQGQVGYEPMKPWQNEFEYDEMPNNEMYLLQKSAEGATLVTFDNIEEAETKAIQVALQHLYDFYEETVLGKTYIHEWSASPVLLFNYLKRCRTLKLKSEIVNIENIEIIRTILQDMNTEMVLKEGDLFYWLDLPKPSEASHQEFKGFMELLKMKPFEAEEVVTKTNGEEVKTFVEDHEFF